MKIQYLNIASIIYWVTILIALLNYGSVELLTVTLLALPLYLLMFVLVITLGLPTYTRSTLWMSAGLLVMLMAWIWIQTSPNLNIPLRHSVWENVQVLVPATPSVLSLSPADDRAAALRIAVPVGVFMVGLLLFYNDERANRALKVLSLSSGIISVFSIAQFYATPDRLLFDAKTAYLSSLTGLFVNRNTAATFFGLALLLNVSVVETALRKLDVLRVLGVITEGSGLSLATQKKVLYATLHFALLLASFTALMLTKSRGGISAAFVAFCFLLALKLLGRRWTLFQSRWVKIAVGSVLLLASAMIFMSLGQRVFLRSQVQDTFEDGRFCVMPGIISAAREHFPFGAGLSSFSSVFPAYRDPNCGIAGVWDRAHNVYMEGLFTLGAAFVVAALVVILWLTTVFIIGIRRRRSARFAGELGLASLLLIALHSAIDFSLQISGLAIFLAAILPPIVTLSLRPPGNRRAHSRKSTTSGHSKSMESRTEGSSNVQLGSRDALFESSKIKTS